MSKSLDESSSSNEENQSSYVKTADTDLGESNDTGSSTSTAINEMNTEDDFLPPPPMIDIS